MRRQMTDFSNFASTIEDLCDLDFCDGGHQLPEAANADVPEKLRAIFPPPYFEWWRAQETGDSVVYSHVEATLSKLEAQIASRGPYDGYLGFSQGGSVAHLLTLLSLRAPEAHKGIPPPRFGVYLSARATRHDAHVEMVNAAAATPLPLPSLVIYGGRDNEVPAELTREMMQTLDPSQRTELFMPEGTHRIPKLNEEQQGIVRGFFEAQLAAKAGEGGCT